MVQQNYCMPKPTEHQCSDDIYKKMLQCWHTEPSDQPTFASLHVFITTYNLKQGKMPEEDMYSEVQVEDDASVEDFDGYEPIDYMKFRIKEDKFLFSTSKEREEASAMATTNDTKT